ncbi:MAG TPA: hypothetical protein VD837_18950 [Terriglobales bacterium]|nr:hypothetical protein [Terriglobales bacterium]
MIEALVIIVALGGLEIVLWCLDRRHQEKQIELLESIWSELAIRNALEEEKLEKAPTTAK